MATDPASTELSFAAKLGRWRVKSVAAIALVALAGLSLVVYRQFMFAWALSEMAPLQ